MDAKNNYSYSEIALAYNDYVQRAYDSSNRPLFLYKIDHFNYNKLSQLVFERLDNIEFKFSDYEERLLEKLDNLYQESIYQFVLEKPKELFTSLEFRYLYDLYCLYIGIDNYYIRCREDKFITIQEILSSKFYKILTN